MASQTFEIFASIARSRDIVSRHIRPKGTKAHQTGPKNSRHRDCKNRLHPNRLKSLLRRSSCGEALRHSHEKFHKRAARSALENGRRKKLTSLRRCEKIFSQNTGCANLSTPFEKGERFFGENDH